MSPSKKEKKDPKKERWFFKINTSLVGLLIKLLLLCWKNNSYLETTIFIEQTFFLFSQRFTGGVFAIRYALQATMKVY